MDLQLGSRIIAKNPLYGGNGSKEEGVFITGEIIRLNENENMVKIKIDEGSERTVSLADIMGIFSNVPEPKKSLSLKVFEKGLDVVFFLIEMALEAIGFICLLIYLLLKGMQRIKNRFKKI